MCSCVSGACSIVFMDKNGMFGNSKHTMLQAPASISRFFLLLLFWGANANYIAPDVYIHALMMLRNVSHILLEFVGDEFDDMLFLLYYSISFESCFISCQQLLLVCSSCFIHVFFFLNMISLVHDQNWKSSF